MPPAGSEADEERRDRELAEVKARTQRVEIGLVVALLFVVAITLYPFIRNFLRGRPRTWYN